MPVGCLCARDGRGTAGGWGGGGGTTRRNDEDETRLYGHAHAQASPAVGPVAVAVAGSCGGGDRGFTPVEGGEALINT